MRDGSVIVLFRVVHHELLRQMQPTILKLKVTLPIVRMDLLPRAVGACVAAFAASGSSWMRISSSLTCATLAA
jgi:hypothetical protein